MTKPCIKPEHVTGRTGYTHYDCRCTACIKAVREYERGLVQKGLLENDPRHGTYTGYRIGCRCEDCSWAHTCYNAARRGGEEAQWLRNYLLKVPQVCPLCETRLQINDGNGKNTSPSLDQILPGQGYTAKNTWVICTRCNSIKKDRTPEDAFRFWTRVQEEIHERELTDELS